MVDQINKQTFHPSLVGAVLRRTRLNATGILTAPVLNV